MRPWLPTTQEARVATVVCTLTLAAALIVLVARTTARGRIDPIAACTLAATAFIVTNKIYSPQYDLWLVPFFVMLPVRTKLVVHFYVSSTPCGSSPRRRRTSWPVRDGSTSWASVSPTGSSSSRCWREFWTVESPRAIDLELWAAEVDDVASQGREHESVAVATTTEVSDQ